MRFIYIKVILLVFCLIGVTGQNAQAERCGPEIKGFQLGMNVEETNEAIQKLGLNIYKIVRLSQAFPVRPAYYNDVTECLADNSSGDNWGADKPGVVRLKQSMEDKDPSVVLHFKDGTLSYIEITSLGIEQLFNAVGTRKGFLKAFANNYHLDMKAYGRNGVPSYYELKDGKQGYIIRCNCSTDREVTSIELSSIPKEPEETGNFSF